MNNNDILRRLRFAFDFSNKEAVDLFMLDPNSSFKLNRDEFLARIAKEDDDIYTECSDVELCCFLDGLIVSKRGLREPLPPKVEKKEGYRLSKNDILKKLRIAVNLREDEMLKTLENGGTILSKSELSALFRNPNHKHYRACGNQVLRNFIKGLTKRLR